MRASLSAGRARSATSSKSGGITPGGDVCLAQERFTEGLFVCAEKIGENDEIRRDYVIRCERNLRMPIYWVLDEKAKVASCIDMRESVKAIIAEIGIDYWMKVIEGVHRGGPPRPACPHPPADRSRHLSRPHFLWPCHRGQAGFPAARRSRTGSTTSRSRWRSPPTARSPWISRAPSPGAIIR